METTTAPAAANLIIGRNGKSIHLASEILPGAPKCGGVRSTGARQAVRRTDRPATCQRCLAS